MAEENIVNVNVRKHKVSIEDELIVHIHHRKTCQKPCLETEKIVEYLQDEMFVAEGFTVDG